MNNLASSFCTVNGIQARYLRAYNNKPPLVLLHGLMLSGACWIPIARNLQNDFDVILPDARGHGLSSRPQKGYSYETLAEDVLSLIKVLNLKNPFLVGHSMGGMTAAVVASSNPNLLKGLVLADPAFLSPKLQQEVYESDVKNQHLQILKTAKEEYLKQAHGRHQNRRSKELIELFAQARYQTSPDAFEVLTPPNPSYINLVKTITTPTLLITGDTNAVVSDSLTKQIMKLNRCFETIKISKAGHAVPFDQPKAFTNHVKTFLSDRILSE